MFDEMTLLFFNETTTIGKIGIIIFRSMVNCMNEVERVPVCVASMSNSLFFSEISCRNDCLGYF